MFKMSFTPASAPQPAAQSDASPVRELELHELAQVSGGSPNGTWSAVGEGSSADSLQTLSPNGTW